MSREAKGAKRSIIEMIRAKRFWPVSSAILLTGTLIGIGAVFGPREQTEMDVIKDFFADVEPRSQSRIIVAEELENLSPKQQALVERCSQSCARAVGSNDFDDPGACLMRCVLEAGVLRDLTLKLMAGASTE